MTSPRVDVAVFLPSLAGGGAERCAVNLAGAWRSLGLQVDLVLGSAGGPLASGVPVGVRTRDLGAGSVLRSLRPLRDYLRTARPAVLLSSLSHANVVAVWARQLAGGRVPLVLWEHNVLSEVLADAGGPWPRLFPPLVRVSYPRADAIIAVTRRAAADLCATARMDEPVAVLPNPVVTPQLFRQARVATDDAWLDVTSVPTVLAVGRLAPQKDLATLIEAFDLVRQDRDARLMILGEGPERPRLESLVRTLGLDDHVRLPGYVPNPYPYLAQASVVASSSRFEGLPTVIIEALALGTPVVATDCRSGPRELLKDGAWGDLVPMGDPRSLADAILATLDGRRPIAPEASWRPYEVRNVARQFLQVFETCGAGLPRRPSA